MGAKTAKQSVINGVEPGDLPSLLKALQSIGVDEADIKSLTAALDDDKSTVKNGIGAKSKRWLAKLGQKAGEKVAEKGADSLVAGVTQALALYFGAAT